MGWTMKKVDRDALVEAIADQELKIAVVNPAYIKAKEEAEMAKLEKGLEGFFDMISQMKEESK